MEGGLAGFGKRWSIAAVRDGAMRLKLVTGSLTGGIGEARPALVDLLWRKRV